MAGAKLKRMGLKPGIPDFIIFSNPLLCLEVKVGRNRLTRAQRDFAERVMSQGHWFNEIRSVDEVAFVLDVVGIPTKAKVSA